MTFSFTHTYTFIHIHTLLFCALPHMHTRGAHCLNSVSFLATRGHPVLSLSPSDYEKAAFYIFPTVIILFLQLCVGFPGNV